MISRRGLLMAFLSLPTVGRAEPNRDATPYLECGPILTKGFDLRRAPITSTDTERAEHMLTVGRVATIIFHDAVLWTQAERLIGADARWLFVPDD